MIRAANNGRGDFEIELILIIAYIQFIITYANYYMTAWIKIPYSG